MIDMYQKAGKIVKEVRELAVKEVHEGMKVLSLINLIESEIVRGGLPAFPVIYQLMRLPPIIPPHQEIQRLLKMEIWLKLI